MDSDLRPTTKSKCRVTKDPSRIVMYNCNTYCEKLSPHDLSSHSFTMPHPGQVVGTHALV